ncbi:hypothetical protein [Cryobacterium sp. AP23]
MGNWRAQVKVAAVMVAVCTLTGCVPGTGYSDLEREATADDAPPADLPEYAFDTMDAASVRFIDEVDGRRVYLAEGTEPQTPVCVLIYRDVTEWMSTCGSDMTTSQIGDFELMVVNDDMPNRDGWTRVSPNVIVRD